jgi:hypothetical protein
MGAADVGYRQGRDADNGGLSQGQLTRPVDEDVKAHRRNCHDEDVAKPEYKEL